MASNLVAAAAGARAMSLPLHQHHREAAAHGLHKAWWRRWRRRTNHQQIEDLVRVPWPGFLVQGRDWGLNGWGQEKDNSVWGDRQGFLCGGAVWAALGLSSGCAYQGPNCAQPPSRQRLQAPAVAGRLPLRPCGLKAAGGWFRADGRPRPQGAGTKPASRAATKGQRPGWVPLEMRRGAHLPGRQLSGLGLQQAPSAGGGAAIGGQLFKRSSRASVASSTRVARPGRCSRGGPGDGAARGCAGDARSAGPRRGDPSGAFPSLLEAGTKHQARCAGAVCRQRNRSRRNSRSGQPSTQHWWRCRQLSNAALQAVGGGAGRRPHAAVGVSRPRVAAHDAAAVLITKKRRRCRRCIFGFNPAGRQFLNPGGGC